MTKTTQKLLQMMLMLVLAGITLNSCEKQRLDGDWDPMEWKDESSLARVDNVYQVPSSGGSYKFHCKNYSVFWVSSIEEDGEHYIPYIDSNDWKDLSGQWTRVQCLPDGDLVVTFQPLSFYSSASQRTMNLCVTAGDIFDYFRFVQKK
ncbi:MAG: hypothetical protein IKT03_06495 [Muribaculaceae bacterium]|nr:hypothetical protein [Muribaculaceae bacterium]